MIHSAKIFRTTGIHHTQATRSENQLKASGRQVITMKVGIGQDSHRFDFEDTGKKLILGGVVFEGAPP